MTIKEQYSYLIKECVFFARKYKIDVTELQSVIGYQFTLKINRGGWPESPNKSYLNYWLNHRVIDELRRVKVSRNGIDRTSISLDKMIEESEEIEGEFHNVLMADLNQSTPFETCYKNDDIENILLAIRAVGKEIIKKSPKKKGQRRKQIKTKAFMMYYIEEKPLRIVGEKFGFSEGWASYIIMEVYSLIKRYLNEKLGYSIDSLFFLPPRGNRRGFIENKSLTN